MLERISVVNFVLVLITALVEIHILEEWVCNSLESASRQMHTSILSVTASITIFICLINFQQVIAIRMLPNSIQDSLPFTKYVKISRVTSVIFLAARSPFIMLFNLERALINMYLAFIFMISVSVVRWENSIRGSFAVLFTTYLCLILGLLSLTYIVNQSELSTIFIMINMITFAIFLNVLMLILIAFNNHKLVSGIIFRSEKVEASQTCDKDSQCPEIAEVEPENNKNNEERSVEMDKNFNFEILQKRESDLRKRRKGKSIKETENTTNEAEAIIDDITNRLEIIEQCANFLLSKT